MAVQYHSPMASMNKSVPDLLYILAHNGAYWGRRDYLALRNLKKWKTAPSGVSNNGLEFTGNMSLSHFQKRYFLLSWIEMTHFFLLLLCMFLFLRQRTFKVESDLRIVYYEIWALPERPMTAASPVHSDDRARRATWPLIMTSKKKWKWIEKFRRHP